jgi:DNA-binding response OmpR family regulator
MHLLVVEDERKIAAFLRRGLEEEGHTVDLASDGEEGFVRASSGDYDLLILDLRLPRLDGQSLCRQLRAQGIVTPVLMLTAKDQLEDKVEGLDSGADDYLTKPFAFEELLARIRALARRTRAMAAPILQVDDLKLDPQARKAMRRGRTIALTNREYQLLELLMRHAGQVVTRAIMLNRIWGYDFEGSTNVVEAYIRLLRKKIDAGEAAKLIHTVRGAGYMLKG